MDDETMFCLFFAQIAGIQFHPRNKLENHPDDEFAHVNLWQIAEYADMMVDVVKKRRSEKMGG